MNQIIFGGMLVYLFYFLNGSDHTILQGYSCNVSIVCILQFPIMAACFVVLLRISDLYPV